MLRSLIEREIVKMLGGDAPQESKSPMIGKICMIRTYSAGVHFGKVDSKNGQNVILSDARRVHYWASACSLSQLAMEGDKKITECRISMAVALIELDQVIEVIPMIDESYKNLTSVTWKK